MRDRTLAPLLVAHSSHTTQQSLSALTLPLSFDLCSFSGAVRVHGALRTLRAIALINLSGIIEPHQITIHHIIASTTIAT